jgi:hypothetical protein
MTDAFKAAPNPSSGLRGISLINVVANTLILGERLRLDGNLTSLHSMQVGENLRQSIRPEQGDFQVRFSRKLWLQVIRHQCAELLRAPPINVYPLLHRNAAFMAMPSIYNFLTI